MHGNQELLRTLPVWLVAFLFTTTCHEAAHAWVGSKLGDSTAEDQVTLDPTPHIRREPIGMLLVPVLSFFVNGGQWMLGWATTPYDPRWASRYPKRAALMAAAGPLADYLLAAIALVVMRVGLAKGFFLPGTMELGSWVVGADGHTNPISLFVSVVFSINVILGTFNLFPVPPLDGYAALPLLLPPRAEYRFSVLMDGPGRFLGLIAAMRLSGYVIAPLFDLCARILYA